MIQFTCDSCEKMKSPNQVWLLGLAAEAVAATAARREVTILSTWEREQAVHPLAVHFCSEACKDRYLASLFEDAVIKHTMKLKRPRKRTNERTGRRRKRFAGTRRRPAA